MKSRSLSYYMGTSYRGTNRPQLQIKFNKSVNINSTQFFQQNQSLDDNENIIHAQKRKKRIEQIVKLRNPYISRKQSQLSKKKQKITRSLTYNNQSFKSFIKVVKIKNEEKQRNIQSNQYVQKDKNQISQPKLLLEKQQVCLEQNKQSKSKVHMLVQQKNGHGLFNHFPSPLFKSNTNESLNKTDKNIATKLSNFFFPSNRVKTENQASRSKLRQGRNYIRPNSSSINRKKEMSEKFNFDGTLQNHKIRIPQRPKTADCRKIQREYFKKVDMLNYATIAKQCIRRRQIRKMDKQLKILPWGNNTSEREATNSVCHSIREQFQILL